MNRFVMTLNLGSNKVRETSNIYSYTPSTLSFLVTNWISWIHLERSSFTQCSTSPWIKVTKLRIFAMHYLMIITPEESASTGAQTLMDKIVLHSHHGTQKNLLPRYKTSRG